MKKAFLLSVFIFAALVFQAQVDFIVNDWKEAAEKAETTDKYIFLDAYTDWCGWCKVMDKNTFSETEVASYMAEHFVPVKLEMEKDEIGKQISMQYVVSSFPSYLIFSPEGELIYRFSGYRPPEQFMTELKEAVKPENQFSGSRFSYDDPLDFPEFYVNSFGTDRTWPEDSVVKAYISAQDDLFSDVNWAVMRRFAGIEPIDSYFLDNYDEYKSRFNIEAVESVLESVMEERLQKAAKENDEDEFNKIMELIDELKEKDKSLTKTYYKVYFFKETEQHEKFADAVDGYIKLSGGEFASYVNSQSWHIYQNVDNKDVVKRAVKWMEKVVAKEPTYAYVDTYAALLFKDGQLEKAEEEARRAIEIGKDEDEKVESTEILLKQILEAKKK